MAGSCGAVFELETYGCLTLEQARAHLLTGNPMAPRPHGRCPPKRQARHLWRRLTPGTFQGLSALSEGLSRDVLPPNTVSPRKIGKGLRRRSEALPGAKPLVRRMEPACTPGSVSRAARAGRGGGHPSRTAVADSLVRSTRGLGRAALKHPRTAPRGADPDLAPGGVYLAGRVTPVAGGLLHHRFTLTRRRSGGRSVFCGTVPRVTPGGRYPPPCSVEPGRSSAGPGTRRDRPAGSSAVGVMVAARAEPPVLRGGPAAAPRRGGRPPGPRWRCPRRRW